MLNGFGYTPAHLAAEPGRVEALKVLIELGVNFSIPVGKPSWGGMATTRGGTNILRLMKMVRETKISPAVGQTPLMLAIAVGNHESAILLSRVQLDQSEI
jgi:ankyrin repeat protein